MSIGASEAFQDHVWEEVTGAYEGAKRNNWDFGTAGAELAALVVDQVIPRGARVLDVGCGGGVEAAFLAHHGMRVIGIDKVAGALERARRLVAHHGVAVELIRADLLRLPFPRGWFDVVSDSFIFHNLRDEARAPYASELARCIRKDGLLVMREFSDGMEPGSGPRRLSSDEIVQTMLPHFSLEKLTRFKNFPTEKHPDQVHWLALWRRRERDL